MDIPLSAANSSQHTLSTRQQRVGNTHRSPLQRRYYLQRHVMFQHVQQDPNTTGITPRHATRLGNPSIYMPDQSSELTALEMPHIKSLLPASITEIDNIKPRVDAPRHSLDVDTLLHCVKFHFNKKNIHTGT